MLMLRSKLSKMNGNNVCIRVLLAVVILVVRGHLCLTPAITFITNSLPAQRIGSMTELSCTVMDGLDYNVLWMKLDSSVGDKLISSGSVLVVYDSRISVHTEANNSRSTYTIKIKNIQETDAGSYCCRLLLGMFNEVTAKTELKVYQPAFISNISSTSLVTFEDQMVEYKCSAGGFPKPEIFWTRNDGNKFFTGKSTLKSDVLKFNSIKKENRGIYYCCAYNGFGKLAKRRVDVTVDFKPIISVPKPFIFQALGHNIYFDCLVEANPPSTIVWMFNRIILTDSANISISKLTTANDVVVTELRIVSIKDQQFGDYTCEATNILGTTNATIRVAATNTPNYEDNEGDVLAKSCSIKNWNPNILCLFAASFSSLLKFVLYFY